ncbi:MAG: magnesium transporter CorA family protein [Granulosicoccaceae bacterium]|jgi:magnesium/cobalt transport protein CorA
MDILHIFSGGQVRQLESIPSLPTEGFVWIDFTREQDTDWASQIARLMGVTIHERHVRDSFNLAHPSFYDSTQDYEMLIFRGLGVDSEQEEFSTRPAVFLLLDRLLVTVRARDSVSFAQVKPRLLEKTLRIPVRPVGMMHLLLTAMVDRFLALREPLTLRFETWRNELLDPQNPFEDWMTVLNHTSYLRKLEYLCDEQHHALMAWREDTETEFDDHLKVRFMDLQEHIGRVLKFAAEQRSEAEAVVQLHFSAVAHRTNEIMRVLTVLSAIFLPLGLVAGIFGMNFEYMPELKIHNAYFFVLGGMAGLAVTLLVMFKIKRWI